jgi:hypothetical protein
MKRKVENKYILSSKENELGCLEKYKKMTTGEFSRERIMHNKHTLDSIA